MTALEFADVTWWVGLSGLLIAVLSRGSDRRMGVGLLAFWATLIMGLAVLRG